jgi:hypothetical protein
VQDGHIKAFNAKFGMVQPYLAAFHGSIEFHV